MQASITLFICNNKVHTKIDVFSTQINESPIMSNNNNSNDSNTKGKGKKDGKWKKFNNKKNNNYNNNKPIYIFKIN